MPEQEDAEWEEGGAATIGEEAEVANAHESAGQLVKEKAAQELIDGESHEALAVAMSGVPPTESDLAVFENQESVVGDGDAMGIGAKVPQDMLGTTEGWLGIDDPVLTK